MSLSMKLENHITRQQNQNIIIFLFVIMISFIFQLYFSFKQISEDISHKIKVETENVIDILEYANKLPDEKLYYESGIKEIDKIIKKYNLNFYSFDQLDSGGNEAILKETFVLNKKVVSFGYSSYLFAEILSFKKTIPLISVLLAQLLLFFL